MKQFSKYDLPDTVEHNGYTYKLDMETTYKLRDNPAMTFERGKHVTVNVLSKNLRGKKDLHNKPYQPHAYIFTKA